MPSGKTYILCTVKYSICELENNNQKTIIMTALFVRFYANFKTDKTRKKRPYHCLHLEGLVQNYYNSFIYNKLQ